MFPWPKSQRVEPREDEPAADQPSSTSSAPGVRVPGTPVGRLLSTASRARPGPYGSLRGVPSTPPVGWLPGPPGLTPVEELPVENRVQRQVQEIEAVRQREDDLSLFHDGEPAESLSEAFLREGWSGSFYNYSLGTTPMSLKEDGEWCFAAKRNDEISLKELSKEERLLFDKSDKVEWDAILATKAVRVISGKEAERIRQVYPDRIISSRMVRRKKPQPELHSWKAKSRWCLHGHADPDTGTLVTYAPTPQSEGIMLFLQAGLNLRMRFSFTDVKNAFCQSSKLKRPRGPLFAEPCEGLHLPPGAIIAIDVPVYGLDDAPASWRLTVASFLTDDLKFQRNVVEPCWYSLFCPNTRRCVAQVLVEVDDFIVGAVDEWRDWLKERLQGRFLFGKWEDDEAEYAGRHVKCTPEGIEVDQGKYVLEQVHPVPLPRGRKAQKDDALSTEEFNALRSLVYKVNWLGRETRPEAAGVASILASRLKHATVQDLLTLNKFVNHLRTTASRPLKLWPFDPQEMCFIVCSDAGGINTRGPELVDEEGLPADATQGAWLVLSAEKLPVGRETVKASPITWRSSKLKRKVFSTFGGETQAMLQGVNEVDWLQIMYRDAVFNDVKLATWRTSLSPHMLVMRGRDGRQAPTVLSDGC